MTQILFIAPVKGAAVYEAFGKEVWMTDTDGNSSMIDMKKDYESAKKAAIKWQIKENKAILKSKTI